MKSTEVQLPVDLLYWINTNKGDKSRAAFIVQCLREYTGIHEDAITRRSINAGTLLHERCQYDDVKKDLL